MNWGAGGIGLCASGDVVGKMGRRKEGPLSSSHYFKE